tara:strand:+ start:8315 stop:8845 length:531 start_codon:yes stop_codon:yes gene_type:complete
MKTIEEVKEHFKNALDVRCLDDDKIFTIDIETIRVSSSNSFWCDGTDVVEDERWAVKLWSETKGFAEIISTKNQHHSRKQTPIYSGVLMYFPDAIAKVSQCSQAGNEQHHKDKPLHWDRSKSGDEKDALVRHLIEAGTIDTDGIRHSAKVAWRALANLQKELEDNGEAQLSKYNKL